MLNKRNKSISVMDDIPAKIYNKKKNCSNSGITLRDVKVIRIKNLQSLLETSNKIFSIKYYNDDKSIMNRAVRNLNELEKKKKNYSRKYWFVDGESIKNKSPYTVGIPYSNIIAVSINKKIYIVVDNKRNSSVQDLF